MAGANPALIVRVAATLEELKANLAEGKNQIETTTAAMTKLATSFSGDRLIQQAQNVVAAVNAIGGASRLTEAEQARVNATLEKALEKYAVLGKTAPAGMRELAEATKQTKEHALESIPIIEGFIAAFSAERIFEFVRGALEAASRLEDLHLATGISTDALQRLSYVGKEFGLDLDVIARGVEQFSAKLANGDANATKAVEMLGLSVKDLLAAGPEEAFLQFAEAAGRVEDPMLKGGLAANAFGGKIAKTLLPALTDLRQKMKEVPQDAIISDPNIKAAHEFEVSLGHIKTRLEAWGAALFGGIAAYEKWLERGERAKETAEQHAAAVDKDTASLDENAKAIPSVITAADLLANRLAHLRSDAMEPLSESQRANITELNKYGVAQKEIAALVGTSEIAVHQYIEAQKKAATEAEQAAKIEAAAVEQTTKLWDEYFALRVSHGGTANDIARAQIDKWAADATAAAIKAKTDTVEFYNALAAVSKEKMAAVGVDWSVFSTKSRAALDEAADNARKTYLAMVASGQFFREDLDKQKQKWDEARDAARGYGKDAVAAQQAAADAAKKHTEELAKQKQMQEALAAANRAMGGSFQYDLTTEAGRAKVPDEIATWLHAGYSLEQASAIAFDLAWGIPINNNDPLFRTKGPRVPGFAGGVADYTGGWAMVGERGPEPMYVPPHASIYPSGTSIPNAGVTNHIVIHVTQPLGTPMAIARAVDEALMARQRAIGERF